MPTKLNLENGRIICTPQTTSDHETVNLVSVLNDTAVTSSLVVAQYFGMLHKDMLRAIRNLECSDEFTGRNFALCEYVSELRNNVKRHLPMYYMTRDGFTFLAMGFTGKIAARFKEAYIRAFDEMEETLRKSRQTKFAEALLKSYVDRLNKNLRKAIREGRRRDGRFYGPCGELQGVISYYDGMSFEDNLRNILSQVQNAYIDGYFFISERFKAEKRLEEIRSAARNLFEKI